jgi:TnpA family transposase
VYRICLIVSSLFAGIQPSSWLFTRKQMPELLTLPKMARKPRPGGRLQIGMVAGFKSERWPKSNRNTRTTCVGIRIYATQAISCGPREAGYVLSGILDNDTNLAIREHTSDTNGFTEHLFALCALLGINFMPRLKDLPDQVLSRIDRDADYGALQSLFRGRINIELILEQWDQLVRLAASLKDRLTPAHVVMQRLVNANASDRLAGALSQLGRLMKTLHILRYIQEEPLRDAIQLQLNRGEFRHILAKSLFFANWGTFRSGDYEEVMNKASCLSLLSNAVLVWNTVHIAGIVDQLRAAGHVVEDEDLARVSPLIHAHVIPNGSYFQSPRRRTGAVPENAKA